MKQRSYWYYFIFLLLLTPLVSSSQVTFESVQVVGPPVYDSTQKNTLADIDGDGDLDVLIEGWDLIWLENIDGLGTFGNQKTILELYGQAYLTGRAFYTVDMDGDADLDILAGTTDQILWVENVDGLGNFNQIHIIDPNPEDATLGYYGDLDGDGDIDVISYSGTFGEVSLVWFENLDGNGNMGDQQIISSSLSLLRDIKCSDVDSDGDLDIVAAKYGNLIWFENLDGNATYSSQNIIGDSVGNFVISDLDDDGDEDIIFADGSLDDIQWYENYGGTYSSMQTIESFSLDIGVCQVGDFDGDGDKDIITNHQGIDVLLNNGDETFTDGGSYLNGAWNLIVGDIDGDSDLDILTASYLSVESVWMENDGNADFTVNAIGPGTKDIRSSHAIDMDNDGDLDLIIGSKMGIYWFENTNGNLGYNIQHFIQLGRLNTIFMDDLDSDGDADILNFNDLNNRLVWFENSDGNGTFEEQVLISTSGEGPTMAITEDLDGDGDIDILLSSSDDNKVAWYANLDGQGNFSEEQVITTSALEVLDIKISDIDNDGDFDIIVPSQGDDSIFWYENTDGSGSFTIEHLVTDSCINVKSLDVNDMDGDGDMDILSTSSNNSSLSWYENTDGSGSYNEANIIDDEANYSTIVYLVDIDNDFDNDVVALNGSTLRWYENMDGQGNFDQNNETIGFVGNTFPSCSLSDIDFDGDIDFLASSDNNYLRLYKNLSVIGNEINGSVYLDNDSNNCQNNESLLSGIMISSSNGIDTFSTFSDIDGSFQIAVNTGDFSTFINQIPNYFDVSPVSYNTNFTDTGSSDTIDFCITPNASVDDLNITIVPQDEPRPGFDVSYQLVYKNIGTYAVDGTITYQYDNSKIQFISADESISSQTINTLSFNFSNLTPFESRNIDLDFEIFAPPTTNIGDELISQATINPLSNDYTENDNVFELEETVIGSYDPNDITCLQGDTVLISNADKYLHYLIRFQNTGTAEAINVRVEQELDNKLDWNTLKIVSLSHRGNVSISEENQLEISFSGIDLPSESMSEPESHGFIAYKIKPKENVAVGDVVAGTANIYFDFNPAIITNTANTEFVENLSLEDFSLTSVSIYPNPVNNELFLLNNVTGSFIEVSIYNIEGRLLISNIKTNENRHTINVSEFKSGVYFLTVQTNQGIETFKVIKK